MFDFPFIPSLLTPLMRLFLGGSLLHSTFLRWCELKSKQVILRSTLAFTLFMGLFLTATGSIIGTNMVRATLRFILLERTEVIELVIIETDAYEEKTHKTVIRDQADIDDFFRSFKSCESSEEEKPMMVGTLEVIFVTRNRDETSYPRFNVSPTLGQLGYSFTPYFRDTHFIDLGEYNCKNASDFLERKAPWRF